MKLNKEIIKGSFILLISINIYNALNFIYQFSMARMLSIEEYGELAALFSIIYIMAVFTESIQTVIAKYASQEKSIGKIKNLFKRSLRKSIFVSLIIFLIFVVISFPLSTILKIHLPLMILSGLLIFPSFVNPLTRGIMQGSKNFKAFGFNLIMESVIRLSFAILFVYLGLKVYGAIFAVLFGIFIALLLSFYAIKDVIKSKEEQTDTKGIYRYSIPVFSIMVVIMIFYSIDNLIAKAVFSEVLAGQYAIASILSKIVFWGTQPISKALFPISSEEQKNKKNKSNTYLTALPILLILIIIALGIIFFEPGLIIRIFAGKESVESASILFTLCLATGALSITNLNLLQRLSTGRLIGDKSDQQSYKSLVKNFILFSSFLIIEIVLLLTFHSNLSQFSNAYLASSIIFLIGSQLILWISR